MGFDWMLNSSYAWDKCALSWLSMFIEPNGDAYFCYRYRGVLGNVFKQNPLRIWNTADARNFRKELLTQNPPLKQCRTCNFARPGWQKGGIYETSKEDVEV